MEQGGSADGVLQVEFLYAILAVVQCLISLANFCILFPGPSGPDTI